MRSKKHHQCHDPTSARDRKWSGRQIENFVKMSYTFASADAAHQDKDVVVLLEAHFRSVAIMSAKFTQCLAQASGADDEGIAA